MSDYVCLFAAIMFLQHEKIDRYFYSFIILATIHFLFFLFYPTMILREAFPIDPGNSINEFGVYLVRLVDSTANCFPSLHIGACFLATFFIRRIKKSFFPLFLIWSILIAISTLTVKQHYFVDILGGICVALFSYFVVFREDLKSLLKIKEKPLVF